ncbi:MAG: polysaccharide deacetylase family protein [Bacteroidales bacterium]|jgi:peptidoglycan/xylan/chitin deacetylase (PgdA/CDA1 family)|nr:polysaccharide deacetylase family protein [Bacteroidales bacterium]
MSLIAHILLYIGIAAFILCPIFIFAAMYFIRLNIFIKAQCKNSTKEILFTFDDGPHPVQTPKVLEVLRRYNVKAMFFLIGENAEKYPDIVRRIAAEGHSIGNHTYSHCGKFPIFSAKKMQEELEKTDNILQEITGKKVEYFRPPFGITNIRISRVIRERGYKVTGWNIRSYDTSLTQEKALNRVIKKLRPHAIILLHDSLPNSEKLLERIFNYIIHNPEKRQDNKLYFE